MSSSARRRSYARRRWAPGGVVGAGGRLGGSQWRGSNRRGARRGQEIVNVSVCRNDANCAPLWLLRVAWTCDRYGLTVCSAGCRPRRYQESNEAVARPLRQVVWPSWRRVCGDAGAMSGGGGLAGGEAWLVWQRSVWRSRRFGFWRRVRLRRFTRVLTVAWCMGRRIADGRLMRCGITAGSFTGRCTTVRW
jgi:hypothetical protein